MRIVYIADDGTLFNSEFECLDYEWLQKHHHINDIEFYTEDGERVTDIFDESIYQTVEKVIVPNSAALEDLYELVEYTGFYSYGSIEEPGIWIWDSDYYEFKMYEE